MIKLLLIDDEQWTRSAIRAFGDWEKYNITIIGEASDGVEGLRMIEENSPEIVITDMNMPGMDGVGLLKILKEQYQNIKVIVVSGYPDFNYTRQAIKSKAVDYILKPVDAEELNNAVEKCVKEINLLKSKKDASVYNLAKALDKDTIAMIMDEKKVIQRLFEEGNISGIKNTLSRLYNNIIKSKPDDMLSGRFLYKVLSEMVEEQLLIIEDGAERSIDKQSIFENNDIEGSSLAEYFYIIEGMLEKAILEVTEFIKNREGSTLTQIKRYVELHYTEHISLEVLANKFFISKEYLSKAFKMKYQKNLYPASEPTKMIPDTDKAVI